MEANFRGLSGGFVLQDEVLLKNCRHCEVWRDVEGSDEWRCLGNCGTGMESEWVGNGRMSRRMRGSVKRKMEILRGAWNCVRGGIARRCIDFLRNFASRCVPV